MKSFIDYSPQKNDIWLCKNRYVDATRETIVGNRDYLVFIVSDPKEINDDEIIRIQPISKQVEFRTNEDLFIDDTTIIGAPFIIETWNEQPILVDILLKKIGHIEMRLDGSQGHENYTDEQLAFRKDEIRNTAFLRQSVLSSLESHEHKASGRIIKFNPGRVISIAASIIGFVFVLWQPIRMSNRELFDTYQKVPGVSVEYVFSPDQLRGDEAVISGLTIQESQIALGALKFYEIEDYTNASQYLFAIPDLINKNTDLLLYLAISQLNSNQPKEAIASFHQLSSIKNYNKAEQVKYFLSLAYVKESKVIKARRLLKEIVILNGEFSEDAQEMLDHIRWF